MALEDDILRNEFSGNEGRVIDAEVVFNRPKKSRKLMYSLLLVGLLASIGVGGFLLMKPGAPVSAAPIVGISKPSVTIPPIDLLGDISNVKPADVIIKPSEPVPTSPAFTVGMNANPLDVISDEAVAPLEVKQVPVTNTVISPAFNVVEAKPELSPVVNPVDIAVKTLAPVAVAPAVSPERFDALEQRVRDLAGPLEALSKKIDTLVSENKTEPSKSRAPSKLTTTIKATAEKKEIVANMQDLHITALLSDGVMFDGDVPVLVGQFSKQLGGRIVSINTDQNVVVTDSKIYKVQ